MFSDAFMAQNSFSVSLWKINGSVTGRLASPSRIHEMGSAVIENVKGV